MFPALKADDVVVGIELNDMPDDLKELPPQEELHGGSTSPKFDQNKLAVVYANNSDTPTQEDPLPSTERILQGDSPAAAGPPRPPPAPAPAPTVWPTNPLAPDDNAGAPVHNNTDFSREQYATYCLAQELKEQARAALQHATYQSAAIQIQTSLSMIRTRKDNISIDDFDTVHRLFDQFMSSHPVLSKGFNEAKMAQQAAMLKIQGQMAAMPGGSRVARSPRLPPIEQQSVINNHNLDNLPHLSLMDPSNLYQGMTASAGGGATVGSLDLLQDVAAAYRYHMTQASQTGSVGDLYINTLRNHLLDKADIDSSAVEILQQLSVGGGLGGGASSGGRGGRNGDGGADAAAGAAFSNKLRQNSRRRTPSCEDLAGSALISLGGGSRQGKDKPGPSASSELERDKSSDVDKNLSKSCRSAPRPNAAAAACGIKRACPTDSNSPGGQDSTTKERS
ncbi:hypothetical protein Ndes2437B_g04760 [Nannochloris sp. 'desiccata']|nr:hypothetical protein KSW81_004536 [Chlorella desiccata (nom. nud.)]